MVDKNSALMVLAKAIQLFANNNVAGISRYLVHFV